METRGQRGQYSRKTSSTPSLRGVSEREELEWSQRAEHSRRGLCAVGGACAWWAGLEGGAYSPAGVGAGQRPGHSRGMMGSSFLFRLFVCLIILALEKVIFYLCKLDQHK